jgi:hypothetical protein
VLAGRIRRNQAGSAASERRALREIESLPFLVRGPICLLRLGMRKQLR